MNRPYITFIVTLMVHLAALGYVSLTQPTSPYVDGL
jgi:hypothetical protein